MSPVRQAVFPQNRRTSAISPENRSLRPLRFSFLMPVSYTRPKFLSTDIYKFICKLYMNNQDYLFCSQNSLLAFFRAIGYTIPANGGLLKWSKRRDSKPNGHFGSLFRKCHDFSRLTGYRIGENFPVFSPLFLSNFRAVLEARKTQFNMQRYRSGHNGADSKSV